MVRVRLQYLLKLEYYRTGMCTLLLQIKLPARGTTYALQLYYGEACTRPACAYTQIMYGRVGSRYAGDRTTSFPCTPSSERHALYKKLVPFLCATIRICAPGLGRLCFVYVSKMIIKTMPCTVWLRVFVQLAFEMF
jgi:hypothetical protein